MTVIEIIQTRLKLMGLCLRIMAKTGNPEYNSALGMAASAKELYKQITGDEWPYNPNDPLSLHL